MRPISIIIIGVLCVYCAAQSPQVLPAAPSSSGTSSLQSSVVVRVWTDSGSSTIENTFDIDLSTRKLTSHTSKGSPTGETPGWAKANIIDRNRNLPTYERIVERVKGDPNRNSDADLAEALRWIEDSKGAGYAPGDFVVASPDGAYAVIKSHWHKSLLLVEVATLSTRRLLDDGGDQAPPVAWSGDSRHIAFAPPKPGELHVYDVEHKVASVVTREAPTTITALSWSPDGQQIAVFGLKNRRLGKNPLSLVAAGAGHPIFKGDGVLFVYRFGGGGFSVMLKRGISEQSTPRARIEWK